MATGVNIAKLAGNLFRNRMTFVQELSEVYKPAISRKRDKVIELIKEKAELASKSELARKIRVAKGFYTLELSPPNVSELEKMKADLALVREFIQTGCWKHLTVKQAWLMFLVGLEIYMWFYLGETFGKWHIVGYEV